MSLFFRPKPFKDKKGNLITLQDLEMEIFHKDNYIHCTISEEYIQTEHKFRIDNHTHIQGRIEKFWNDYGVLRSKVKETFPY